MKYLDEYRDAGASKRLGEAIAQCVTKPWTIMEVCGGQTHSIVRHGLDELLPKALTLVHGPGCPVCVTPIGALDTALALAARPEVIFTSFGDMLRVPGSTQTLLGAKAAGADVRMVYSPLDAVTLARNNPNREVVFFAVGFETTAPACALAVKRAHAEGVKNFSLLVSHVLVPPAMEALLSSPDNRVQGFLAPGHVCAVVGCADYERVAAKYKVPIVVTGFEPVDILHGILLCVKQLEEGRHEVENPYARCVRAAGNAIAQQAIAEVFQVVAREWRGIGTLPLSGLGLRPEFAAHDATLRFGVTIRAAVTGGECISGEILRGVKKPRECLAFGTRCTPEHPLGATMVSSEGACAAYYRYRR